MSKLSGVSRCPAESRHGRTGGWSRISPPRHSNFSHPIADINDTVTVQAQAHWQAQACSSESDRDPGPIRPGVTQATRRAAARAAGAADCNAVLVPGTWSRGPTRSRPGPVTVTVVNFKLNRDSDLNFT